MEPLAYEISYSISEVSTTQLFDSWFSVHVEIDRIRQLPESSQPVFLVLTEYGMDGCISSVETLKIR